jgi:pimeloyl-ACP methyl ester carboxylesterase
MNKLSSRSTLSQRRETTNRSAVELHFKDYGSGYPLLILHGLFGMLDNWHSLSRRFAEHFHVFAVDQRNHGRSPHTESFSYELMARDLLAFMDHHHLREAHIIGHSMGGKTAMQFALSYPERVSKLVVVDIAPKKYPRKHDQILEAIGLLDIERYRSRGDIDEALKTNIGDVAVRQFLLKNLRSDGEGRYRWKMNLDAIRRNYENVMGAIDSKTLYRKPTLFLKGVNSSYVTDEDEKEIKRLFPNSKIESILGAGHWIHAEAPEKFVNVTLDFLINPAIRT